MRIQTHASESSFEDLARQVWTMISEVDGPKCFRSHGPHRWRPHLNLYETPDGYLICVELSGMEAEKIIVRAGDDMLHIIGDRPKPEVPGPSDRVGVHLMEIDSGPFHRKVPVPRDVDTESISACYRQGYLWITLPRSTERGGE